MPTQAVILYDGYCALCSRAVRFIINHDPDRYFLFAPLNSTAGGKSIKEHKIDIEDLDSLILLRGSDYLVRSEAALSIAKQLSGGWSLLYFLSIIPQPIRDWCYDQVARHRHKLFGKADICYLPSEADLERILE